MPRVSSRLNADGRVVFVVVVVVSLHLINSAWISDGGQTDRRTGADRQQIKTSFVATLNAVDVGSARGRIHSSISFAVNSSCGQSAARSVDRTDGRRTISSGERPLAGKSTHAARISATAALWSKTKDGRAGL